jgi:hypothetical protein
MYEISDISNLLKKVIAPRVEELLPSETVLLNKVKVNSGVTNMGNNQFFVSLRTGRHSGIASIPEGAQLTKGKATWDQARIDAKYTFGTFNLSDQSIEASKSNKGALVSILQENERALRQDLARHLNRGAIGNGDGVVATANGGATGTTLTVDHAPGTGVTEDRDGTKYLAAGQYIKIGANTANLIVSVDSATQVTLTTSQTWSDNDAVVLASPDDNASEEVSGFQQAIAASGTFQNIARAGKPWWQGSVESSNSVLTEAHLVKPILEASEFGKVDVGFTNLSLFNKFGELLVTLKRTADLKEVLSGGWMGLQVLPGVGLMLEFDVPGGEVQLWDFDAVTIGRLADLSWLDVGGGNVLRINDYAEWQGSLKHYGNFAWKNVRSSKRITSKKIA